MDQSAPVSVLFVGDDIDVASARATHLEAVDERLSVETAVGVANALSRLDAESHDCVVSEQELTDSDGIEFLERLRAEYRSMPFVFFARGSSESLASEAIEAGATAVVRNVEGSGRYVLLANTVRNAVERSRATRREATLDLLREVNRVLVAAETRATIERGVCDIIAGTEPYRSVWIGAYDPTTRTVEPRAAAGVDAEDLDTIRVPTESERTGEHPVVRAVRSGELAVGQCSSADGSELPHEDAKGKSLVSAAVPLVSDGTLSGVLFVSADRMDAFDERTRPLFADVGEDIARAVRRTEGEDDDSAGGDPSPLATQQDMDRQLRLFREAVESAGHSVYFTDVGGTIEYVNPAFEETTGYSATEAIGQTPRILKSGEHDRSFYEDLWGTILDGDVWRSEIVNRTKSGERYTVDQTIAPVEGPSGDIEHFVAVNADITEQRARERELKRQNERLDEFTSVVSHDLRNPLNVAQGNLEMAREDPDEEYFDAIDRSLKRMEALIQHLLTLARKGGPSMALEPTSLADVATESWESVDTADGSLTVDAPLTIEADRTRLRELFENIYRNAVEHGSTSSDSHARQDAVEHGGESVTVSVGALDDGFYVADDGPGIPPEKREDVFDCGFTTSEDGTGFGLHIVHRIAEEHEWDLSVTASEDGGARFEVRNVDLLPADEALQRVTNCDD